MAKVWRKESIEEMEHADKFTDRILFLDGFPNMQVLDPLRIGQNVKEIIECDLASEIAARTLYQEAATYCHGVKDYVSRDLFEKLMKDEEESYRLPRNPARSDQAHRTRTVHPKARRRPGERGLSLFSLPDVGGRPARRADYRRKTILPPTTVRSALISLI